MESAERHWTTAVNKQISQFTESMKIGFELLTHFYVINNNNDNNNSNNNNRLKVLYAVVTRTRYTQLESTGTSDMCAPTDRLTMSQRSKCINQIVGQPGWHKS